MNLPQQQHIDVIDTDRIEHDRARIWKAAIAQYRAGMQPMLSSAYQGQSDKQNEGYSIENPFISAVETRCLPELKESSGFPINHAIEQSLVCASTEQTDDGLRVIQRPPPAETSSSWLRASRNWASSVTTTPRAKSAPGNGALPAQTTQSQLKGLCQLRNKDSPWVCSFPSQTHRQIGLSGQLRKKPEMRNTKRAKKSVCL